MRPTGIARWCFSLLLVIAAVAFGAGCVSVKAGRLPNLSLLNAPLQRGVSTSAEVISQLGPPFGRGSLFLPFQDAPRESIYYYYEEGTPQDDRRIFLFVFLKNDRYDGYMWFSSIPHTVAPAAPSYPRTVPASQPLTTSPGQRVKSEVSGGGGATSE